MSHLTAHWDEERGKYVSHDVCVVPLVDETVVVD